MRARIVAEKLALVSHYPKIDWPVPIMTLRYRQGARPEA